MAVLRSRVPPILSVRLPALVPRLLSLRLLADERRRGILLLLAATVFFSCSDATSKYVTRTLPVIEVAWVRYAVFVLATLAVAVKAALHGPLCRSPARHLGLYSSLLGARAPEG